ncbi:MAG: MBL fold metallo-hydrolase [Paludibacteraceae bacterium]|nr:MBL fold metallo-hydrolase [Paludibacteraceae bacterium]
MRMKTTIIILSILALLIVAVVAVLHHPAFGRRMSPERKARIEASPNYRDGMFQNQLPTPQFTGDQNMLKAAWTMLTQQNNNRVPVEPLPAVKTDLKSLPTDRDWFVWFGHSSYLFCLGGKRYLVDPILKLEFPASLMLKPFKGTDIYTPEDVPDIDYLVITHEHWDHLDYATLRDLHQKVKHVVCPLGVAEYLEYWHYDKAIISELDWFEKAGFITCLPSRHFSNRLLRGRNQTLWAAYIVEAGGRKVYIGGDGGYDDRFHEVREQFGRIDLAIMENGQYNPNWAYVHMLPKDLEQAILDLNAQAVFTVHHDKFALSTHAWSEPDSVAHSIAERNTIKLLDQPIGSVTYF